MCSTGLFPIVQKVSSNQNLSMAIRISALQFFFLYPPTVDHRISPSPKFFFFPQILKFPSKKTRPSQLFKYPPLPRTHAYLSLPLHPDKPQLSLLSVQSHLNPSLLPSWLFCFLTLLPIHNRKSYLVYFIRVLFPYDSTFSLISQRHYRVVEGIT